MKLRYKEVEILMSKIKLDLKRLHLNEEVKGKEVREVKIKWKKLNKVKIKGK